MKDACALVDVMMPLDCSLRSSRSLTEETRSVHLRPIYFINEYLARKQMHAKADGARVCVNKTGTKSHVYFNLPTLGPLWSLLGASTVLYFGFSPDQNTDWPRETAGKWVAHNYVTSFNVTPSLLL